MWFGLALLLLCPQDKPKQDPRATGVLTPAEQQSLAKKAANWLEASIELEEETRTQNRERLRTKETQAREAFLKEWDSREKAKGSLLKHLADVRAIFATALPFKASSFTGEIKLIQGRKAEEPSYGIVVPKTYRATEPMRCIVSIPSWNPERKAWAAPADHFTETWKGSELAGDTIFVVPSLAKDLEFETIENVLKDADTELERRRIAAVFSVWGAVHREMRLNLDRLILDAGRGSSAFAVRLATYFPSRFAGLVLRWPADPGQLRLENLTGLPVLLVANAETKANADKLAAKLNELQPGSATVLEGKGAYPYAESKAEIAAWAKGVQRDLFRAKVTLAPNSNLFKRGYWVAIGRSEAIDLPDPNRRPFLQVEADREKNRIQVTARGVSDFTVLLNDSIVDLDKPVTFVVNGQAREEKLGRDLRSMIREIVKVRDATLLYCSSFGMVVPQQAAENDKKDGGGESAR